MNFLYFFFWKNDCDCILFLCLCLCLYLCLWSLDLFLEDWEECGNEKKKKKWKNDAHSKNDENGRFDESESCENGMNEMWKDEMWAIKELWKG